MFVTFAKLAARPGVRELRKRAISTAKQASALLPKIVQRIEDRLEVMEDKQLVSAGHLLKGLAHHNDLVAEAAGHLKNQLTSQKADTIVNVQINGDMPFEERMKIIQATVTNTPYIEAKTVSVKDSVEKQPVALPAPAQVQEVGKAHPQAEIAPQVTTVRFDVENGRSLQELLVDL